jgi:sulfur relay protein TusB/DsrH
MGTLYLVTRSPFERGSWELALKLAASGDGVCFIQDGVLAVRGPQPLAAKISELEKSGVRVWYLKEDLEARGLEAAQEKTIDYDKLAELVAEFKRIIT